MRLNNGPNLPADNGNFANFVANAGSLGELLSHPLMGPVIDRMREEALVAAEDARAEELGSYYGTGEQAAAQETIDAVTQQSGELAVSDTTEFVPYESAGVGMVALAEVEAPYENESEPAPAA